MRIHTDILQRSPEWFALRVGRITGTSFNTMANGTKDGIETLCLKTAAERITGVSIDEPYTNPAMENGVCLEAEARESYETTTFAPVLEVGFLELDEYVGVSPDGLVGDEGGVEIKCPQAHTHLKYRTNGGNAWLAYKWQVQGALWVTGRKWWDFVSYCPAFPPSQRLHIERVTPDAEAFKKLDEGANRCRARIAELVAANG
jgi:hypothetical protein